jgi:hypothetical protein
MMSSRLIIWNPRSTCPEDFGSSPHRRGTPQFVEEVQQECHTDIPLLAREQIGN